jgi:5-methylcytosine-specific restriction protein A
MLGAKRARACLTCGRITTQHSNGRCPDCASAHDRRQNAQRGTRTQRGYDNRWLRVSKSAIRRQPWCSDCGTAGDKANPLTGHHVTARSKGGPGTAENVMVLCRRCNSARGNRG